MARPRTLVVFATRDGHTRKVAKRIAEMLADRGLPVVLSDVDRLSEGVPADGLAGMVVAAPVRFGRHPRKIRRFVARHREEIGRVPTAFVSVSGSAIGDDDAHSDEARGYVERFLGETGWSPDRTATVGGAIAYTRYNPVLRRVMRSIAEREGRSTDTSRDHEYTDWAEVEEFARTFADLVERRIEVGEAVAGG